MRKPFAILGSVAFFIAAPGVVAGLMPWLLSGQYGLPPAPCRSSLSVQPWPQSASVCCCMPSAVSLWKASAPLPRSRRPTSWWSAASHPRPGANLRDLAACRLCRNHGRCDGNLRRALRGAGAPAAAWRRLRNLPAKRSRLAAPAHALAPSLGTSKVSQPETMASRRLSVQRCGMPSKDTRSGSILSQAWPRAL